MAANLARAHWYDMGRWLYAHLADGDMASNFLSWQWVAGTSVSKRYTVDQSLIDSWSGTAQKDSILNFRREDMSAVECPAVLRTHEPFAMSMSYPVSTVERSVAGQSVVLYTPWTLSLLPDTSADRHIVVFDPFWFDRFPVSVAVRDFIVTQGAIVIPGLEVWSGDMAAIPGMSGATRCATRRHQTNAQWQGVSYQEPDWLFPQVEGYFPSFFAYWQKASRYLSCDASL